MTETVMAPCACCGAYSNTLAVAQPPALFAVCDVLVVRALEVVGKRIVRADRKRFNLKGNRPWHVAHTLWPINQNSLDQVRDMDKGLDGAWDVVPALLDAHGCCGITSGQVTAMLDQYVRDLLVSGHAHDINLLRYRFERVLGVQVTPV